MGDYAECQRSHPDIGGKQDGCQEFKKSVWDEFKCESCSCHRNFHRKVTPPVKYKREIVYTTCQKIHEFNSQASVDGCQEFIPNAERGSGALFCATCSCKRGFHRKETVSTEVTSTY